jgi:hypothetical protein
VFHLFFVPWRGSIIALSRGILAARDMIEAFDAA